MRSRLRPTLLLLLATSLPLRARAATLTLGDALVSRAQCLARATEELTLEWDLGSTDGSAIELLGSDASGCSETDATTEVLVDGLGISRTSYPATGEAAITIAEVLSAAGASAGTCDGGDFRVYVCVRLVDDAGDVVATASAALKFELERPPPPVDVATTFGENALYVSWTAGTATAEAPADAETYRAFASAGGTVVQSDDTTGTTVRLGGLENGTTYDVWVIAYSASGTASEPSELVAGTPSPTDDFWQVYEKAGGLEQGGCSQPGGGGLLPGMAALLLVGLRRARRRALAVALLAVVAGASGCASGPQAAPPPPHLPRSSIAAVLARAHEADLGAEQVSSLAALDEELALRVEDLRARLGAPPRHAGGGDARKDRAGPAGEPSGRAGPDAGGGPDGRGPPGGGGHGPGGPGAMGGGRPPARETADRAAELQQRLDDADTAAWLKAEALLEPSQRERAREIASEYRAARYDPQRSAARGR